MNDNLLFLCCVFYFSERKLYRLLLLSVGILCIIQAALNVSLRLVGKFSMFGEIFPFVLLLTFVILCENVSIV